MSVQNAFLDARSFGSCTWDATHDVAPCINAAITYANTLPNGATVFLPQGDYQLASTVTLSKSLVSLITSSHGAYLRDELVVTQKIAGTHLTWTGAVGATMLSVTPPTDLVAGQAISGVNVKGVLFDANQIANTCARFASVLDSWIDVECAEPAGAGVIFDTAPIKYSASFQNNDVWVTVINRLGSGPAVLWAATGNTTVGYANGNVSINRFRNIRIATKNGDGLVSVASDNNIVDMLNVQILPGGTGNAVVFNGTSDVNAPTGSVSNLIIHYSANGPFLVKGTDAGFTWPAINNTILHLDSANATPSPVIGTGASIVWRSGNNIWSAGQGSFQANFALSATELGYLGATPYVDPVRVYSESNGGVLVGTRSGGLDVLGHLYVDPSDNTMRLVGIQNIAGVTVGGPNAPMNIGGIARLSVTVGIVAHAGGGQASATALTTAVNRVITVTTAGDSVKLPAGASGMCVDAANNGNNAMQVFGSGTDTINGIVGSTGVSVAAGKTGHWCATGAGLWNGGTYN